MCGGNKQRNRNEGSGPLYMASCEKSCFFLLPHWPYIILNVIPNILYIYVYIFIHDLSCHQQLGSLNSQSA